MTDSGYKKAMILLGLAGLLFSGYLSAFRLITSVCALSEPCPYFLGYPACWYGFGMFFLLFASALVGFFRASAEKSAVYVQVLISGLGILFAGYFTVPEISNLLSGTSAYSLGLPTCAYGLIFYVIIFVLAFRYLRKQK